ncbi:16377_t:CDS:2, partial [Acaulospora colombiana]
MNINRLTMECNKSQNLYPIKDFVERNWYTKYRTALRSHQLFWIEQLISSYMTKQLEWQQHIHYFNPEPTNPDRAEQSRTNTTLLVYHIVQKSTNLGQTY